MKAGRYCIKELFVNRYLHQIVIPEIQRDYVWKEKEVLRLFRSIIKDFQNYKNKDVPEISSADKELEAAFSVFYKKRYCSSNIGFIYAYNDEEYQGKYFLIDGQQRITTLFLILLGLAYTNTEINKSFRKIFINQGQNSQDATIKIDYKVRDSAHQFLRKFTAHVLKRKNNFKDQSWYFSNQYKSDETIQSIMGNFEKILEEISHFDQDLSEGLFEYILNQVEFWYFDTNISEQGEELYIYMNARGEQMQQNENLKADFINDLNPEEKNDYGIKWEEWQNFFWKNRNTDDPKSNADKGFNEFLSWAQFLLYFSTNPSRLHDNDVEKYGDVIRGKENNLPDLSSYSVQELENFFNTVKWFFKIFSKRFESDPLYFKIINDRWLQGNINQQDKFRLFPILYFIYKFRVNEIEGYDITELKRLIRLLFNLRNDDVISKTAATQTLYALRLIDELSEDFKFDDLIQFRKKYKTVLNDEETLKINTLRTISDLTLREKTRRIFGVMEDNDLLKGKIGFLISISNELNADAFSLTLFEKTVDHYKDLIADKGILKSELIATDSFTHSGDRIRLNDDWFKKKKVCELLRISINQNFSRQELFDYHHKDFLKNYNNVTDIIAEENPKKQLFIYYLLSELGNINWDWKKGENIGISFHSENLNSLFNRELFFQHYHNQWHENEWRYIEIQKSDVDNSVFSRLINSTVHA